MLHNLAEVWLIKQEEREFGHPDEIFPQSAQLTSISFIWVVTLEY